MNRDLMAELKASLAPRTEAASYVYLPAGGKCHIRLHGADETLCGRPAVGELRTPRYSPSVCARCGKDAVAVAAAEAKRHELYEKVAQAMKAQADRHRAGVFTVYRCKLCGLQHHAPPERGGGVPFCTSAGHVAELEEVEAQGPTWLENREGVSEGVCRSIAASRRKERS